MARLRHSFATDALRAGLPVYELSKFMRTSVINIDRTYGHLARDALQHSTATLDAYDQQTSTVDTGGRPVDTAPRRRALHAVTETAR